MKEDVVVVKVYNYEGDEIKLVDFDKVMFVENSNDEIRYIFGKINIEKFGSDVYQAIPKFIESIISNETTIIDVIVTYGAIYRLHGYLYGDARYGSFEFDTYDHVHIKYDLKNGVWTVYNLNLNPK